MDRIPPFVHDALANLDTESSPDQLESLGRYLDLLLDANQRVNLTAVKERNAAWRRLILDSLTLLPGLTAAGDTRTFATAQERRGGETLRIIDVGTGGGLPGIPLAIARPDLAFTLLDATGKKVRFLESVITALGLEHVVAVHARAEELGHLPEHRQRYDAAVCRAVGPVAEVLEYCLPLVRVGGKALLMKGRRVQEELTAAGDALVTLGGGETAVFDAYPEREQEGGAGGLPASENPSRPPTRADKPPVAPAPPADELVIISVIKERATPSTYPRRPGLPRHEPL